VWPQAVGLSNLGVAPSQVFFPRSILGLPSCWWWTWVAPKIMHLIVVEGHSQSGRAQWVCFMRTPGGYIAILNISSFKVLRKQLFSIRFPLASCFMQILFHFFCKVCTTTMNIFFEWYLHEIYLHYNYIDTPHIKWLVHSMSIMQ
jgi:hypothetical protein